MSSVTTPPATTSSLLSLALTDVNEPIPDSLLYPALSSPPFVYIPGTFNTRDLGLLPVPPGTPSLRPGLIYRSGSLSGLHEKPEGKAVIQKLGIKTIFDLRSVGERRREADPEVEGVVGVWVEGDERDAMEDLENFKDGEGEKGFEKMYLGVMEMYRGAFRKVLEWVRDGGKGGLVHCNAGRDRTGVISGLLLSLAGVDPDTVALDFLLSRIGTEPARQQLLDFAKRGTGIDDEDIPGFHNLCSLRISCWKQFLKGVEREFGGWNGYITETLGFSQEDLAKIKHNLVAEP